MSTERYFVQVAQSRWPGNEWWVQLNLMMEQWMKWSNEAIERSADEDPVFDLVVGLMGLTGRLFNFSDPVSSYGWMKRAAWELNGLVDRVPGDLFPDNIPNSSRNEICNTILSQAMQCEKALQPIAESLRDHGTSQTFRVLDSTGSMVKLISMIKRTQPKHAPITLIQYPPIYLLVDSKTMDVVALASFGAHLTIDVLAISPRAILDKIPHLEVRILAWMFKTSPTIAQSYLALSTVTDLQSEQLKDPINKWALNHYISLGAEVVGGGTTVRFTKKAIETFLSEWSEYVDTTETWKPSGAD